MARSTGLTAADAATASERVTCAQVTSADAPRPRRRFRVRFRKEGDLRWIGHLDLLRVFERTLRRAGLQLSFTAGCHPRPRLSVFAALPIGEMGSDEVLEVALEGNEPLEQIRSVLVGHAPAGLVIASVDELSAVDRGGVPDEFAYELALPPEMQDEIAVRVERMLAQSTLMIERGDEPAVDLRDLLLDAAVDNGVLRFRLHVPQGRQLRARDVLQALGLNELREQGCYPVRTEVVLR